MHCFPKSDPDVEHAQPRAQATNKATGKHRTQAWRAQKEIIVSPFWPPRKNDKQYPDDGAQKYKQQHQDAADPEPRA